MKVALIGFGHAGKIHLSAIGEVKGANTTAVCDPASERQEAAWAAGIPGYAHLHDLLIREDIDAAVICTPPRQHAAAALACLAQGVHVLCEKPLASASQEAVAMFEAANHHTVLAVASKFRHVDEVQRVHHLLHSGALGEPVGFHISFRSMVDMTARWNSHPDQSGGGVIADNGGHVFDLASYLLGPIAHVKAVALAPIQPLPVEDSATLEIETCAGVVGTAELSWSLPPAGDAYLTIQGSEATAVVGWKQSQLKRKGHDWESFGKPYDRGRAHRQMHRAFADAVRNRDALWISRDECLQAVGAVEACYRSLRSGNTESLLPAPAIDGTQVERTASARAS